MRLPRSSSIRYLLPDLSMLRMGAVFAEWERRYRDEPKAFLHYFERVTVGVEDFGQRSAAYFTALADEMDAAGLLPTEFVSP